MPPMVARDAVEISTGNHSAVRFQRAIEIVQHDAGLDHAAPVFDVQIDEFD